ncbi:MAG TPA: GNAT family N-acetyltransferase [Nocardioidaceae bacterium]|nr:GNAT family N-acetyltransferase [Nocardioidaceae bacterium]
MAEVTVRDAHRSDATAIGAIWTRAVPYLVRSRARAAADLRRDGVLGRRRWVAILDGEVSGIATGRAIDGHDPSVFLTVEVHPDRGSRGVGSALLRAAATAFPDVVALRAVGNGDPVSVSFAVRYGFVPDGERHVSVVDPRTVARAGPPPLGLRAVPLEAMRNLRMLLDTHNLAASDDPSGLSWHYTMQQLRADWWDSPDNAPELSWGLLADERGGPVLAAFSSVQVDRDGGRSWSSMTATHPAYRGRGLAGWVKRRTLNALAEVGVVRAWTAYDSGNAPMLAVNAALGYQPETTSLRLTRRLHH